MQKKIINEIAKKDYNSADIEFIKAEIKRLSVKWTQEESEDRKELIKILDKIIKTDMEIGCVINQ